MARHPEPWFWEERKGWYAVVNGRRRPLAKGRDGKAEARKVLGRLLHEEDSAGVPKVDKLDLHALIAFFVKRVERECEASTLTFYKSHLEPFAGKLGAIPSAELRPKHLNHYLDTEGEHWADSTRRGCITAVKAMSSWATKQGYLASDPLKDVKRPRMGRREALDPRIAAVLISTTTDQTFQDLLIALFESGCRPGEVYKVTSADFDPRAGTWTLHGKTTNRTGKDRVIYLTPKLLDVCARLAESRKVGPLFRNSDGNPWNNNSVRSRFRRRREKFGPVQAYGIRHLFGTDALTTKRLPPAVVAALMGHSDLKMLLDHYGHVDERNDLLRDAVASVRPPVAGSSPGPDASAPASAEGT